MYHVEEKSLQIGPERDFHRGCQNSIEWFVLEIFILLLNLDYFIVILINISVVSR